MSYPIKIYEFYRAFDNIRLLVLDSSNPHGEYVSGGYSPEKINRPNHPVPEEIKGYVHAGYFSINDNYPPDPGEVALIAREIGEYAVLAVANRQKDDGGRPTIGYRYFWLWNPKPSEFDGVETLLKWWQPRNLTFNMEEAFFNKNNAKNHGNTAELLPIIDLNHYSDIAAFVEQNNSLLPVTKVAQNSNWSVDSTNESEFVKLHYQTLGLKLHYSTQQLAWAWNVKRLLQPSSFLCIYYAPGMEGLVAIPSRQRNTQVPNVSSSITNNTSQNRPPNPPTPRAPRVRHAVGTEGNIRDCLTTISRKFSPQKPLDNRSVEKLFEYLINYPCSEYDWSNYIDPLVLKSQPDPESTYQGLLAILIPEITVAWLHEVSSNFQNSKSNRLNWLKSPKEDALSLAFEIQNQIIELAKKQNTRIYEQLNSIIFEGIYSFLVTILNGHEDIEPKWEQAISLLTNSKSVWSNEFKKSKNKLCKQLKNQVGASQNQKIIEIQEEESRQGLIRVSREISKTNTQDYSNQLIEEAFKHLTNYLDLQDEKPNLPDDGMPKLLKKEQVVYEALLAIVIPERTAKWLDQVARNFQSSKFNFLNFPKSIKEDDLYFAFGIQSKILEIAKRLKNNEIHEQLNSIIFQGISSFLTNMLLDSKKYHKQLNLIMPEEISSLLVTIKWQQAISLLRTRQTVWSIYFLNKFEQKLWNELNSLNFVIPDESTSLSKFAQFILVTLNKVRKNRSKGVSYRVDRYFKIAKSFRDIRLYKLAGLFYLFYKNPIREDIYSYCRSVGLQSVIDFLEAGGKLKQQGHSGDGKKKWYDKIKGEQVLIGTFFIAFLILAVIPVIDIFPSYRRSPRSESESQPPEKYSWQASLDELNDIYFDNSEQLHEELKNEYVPDPSSNSADIQTKLAREFLLTSEDEGEFKNRINKLEECKNGDYQQFGSCIFPDPEQRQQIMDSIKESDER
ncbi:MAG: hypothetical protein F6K47_29565 [Symploca sp. SIO2E6]|nr:hypothetical protein [Symploca sp. SIO2E6]